MPLKPRFVNRWLLCLVVVAVVLISLAQLLRFEEVRRHVPPRLHPSPNNPDGSFKLSKTLAYRSNFVAPRNNARFNTAASLSTLSSFEAAAAAQRANDTLRALLAPPSLAPTRLFSVVPGLEADGYVVSKELVDPWCPTGLVRVPAVARGAKPLCLSVLLNAYLGTQGPALHPATKTLYEIGGGCCTADWLRYNREIHLPPSAAELLDKHGKRVLLSMCFHHDITYHHVIHELLPRYVMLAPLLDAAPNIMVAIDNSDIAEALLLKLGISRSRLVRFPNSLQPDWRFAGVLLVPPPCIDGFTGSTAEHLEFYPRNMGRSVAALFTGLTVREEDLSDRKVDEVTGPRKQVMLLIERATKRGEDGGCRETRCLKNFAHVRKALRGKFGKDFDVQVYRAHDKITTAIKLFSQASVVIGVHGAGFQNIMFCRAKTTVVDIGWSSYYGALAKEFDLSYHRYLILDLQRDTRNYVLQDVKDLVNNVSIALDKDKRH